MVEIKVIDVTPPGWGKHLIASYLIIDDKIALIETGPARSYQVLRDFLDEEGVKPDIVVVTHIHLDHGGAIGHFLRDYPDSTVLVHPRGAKHLVNPLKLWNAAQSVLGEVANVYGEPLPAPEDKIRPVEDGYTVELGSVNLKIIHTPGHASHHMSILLQPNGILFTGDSAGVVVKVGDRRIELPTTPPPFHPKLYYSSLEKMESLKPSHPAPTHYGILSDDGVSYLEREKDRVMRWYGLVKSLVSDGIQDIDEVSEKLAEKDRDASIAYHSENPIIREVFYKGTIWGLIEAVKKELGI